MIAGGPTWVPWWSTRVSQRKWAFLEVWIKAEFTSCPTFRDAGATEDGVTSDSPRRLWAHVGRFEFVQQ